MITQDDGPGVAMLIAYLRLRDGGESEVSIRVARTLLAQILRIEGFGARAESLQTIIDDLLRARRSLVDFVRTGAQAAAARPRSRQRGDGQ